MTEHTLEFSDYEATRRYFARVARVLRCLMRIASEKPPEAVDADHEVGIMVDHLNKLSNSFAALAFKHIMTGKIAHRLPSAFEIDRTDSGFPVFREFMQLETDLELTEEVLFDLPEAAKLKREMVDHMLKFRTLPRDLQFAMAQRKFFEIMASEALYLTQNQPSVQFVSARPPHGHRRYIIDWAVYDTQRNLPDVYVMVLDDSAGRPLHEDDEYAGALGDALLAQSLSTLKLVTIARGIDTDFPTIHPKSLKRVHVGPLYASDFTRHSSGIGELLEGIDAGDEDDWVFGWTVENLASKGVEYVRSGLFGKVQKEIFNVETELTEAFEAGSTSTEKYMILPLGAYQTLAESELSQFDGVHKFVVGEDDEVISHP